MILFLSNKIVTVLKTNNRNHLSINHLSIKEDSLKNKFNCKLIYPHFYSDFIKWLNIAYNHEFSRLFSNDTFSNVKFDSKNYIIISNHGISKRLNLAFSFETGFNFTIKDKDTSFYYIITLDNINNMISLSLYSSEYHADIWKLSIQNDDISKKLLKNISFELPKSKIIKIYFENYKTLLFSFIEENEKIYKASLKHHSTQDSYSSYKNMICFDKEQNKMRKLKLDISQKYYKSYPHFLMVSYYMVITRHRLVSSAFIINGLFKGYNMSYDNIFIDLNKVFFIHKSNKILLIDNLQAILDTYKGNTRINIVDTNYSTILSKVRRVEAESYINIYWSKLIEVDEENWIYLYYKQEKEKHSYLNIFFNVIEISLILLKKMKMKIYSPLDEIYRDVEYINLHIEEITKLIDDNMKIDDKKIYNKLYAFHDNYILKIPISFYCFLLDEDQIKKLKAIIIDKLAESIPENILEKEFMIYKVINSFFGPVNVEIDLSNSMINKYYSDNFISQKIMNFTPVIAEVEKEDGVYYLFEMIILDSDTKSSIKIEGNKNEYRLKIARRTKYNNEQLTDKILIKLYKNNNKHIEEYYENALEGIKSGSSRNLVISFAVKKEIWNQIKCKRGDLKKIRGLFYLYSYEDSIKIMCTWNEHEVIFECH
ncbi:MAG: hypothetical protein QXF12_01640 [Candidatus Aenigmatarchaeota archaeon]